MGLRYVGQISLGALCPLQVSATIGTVTELQAKLDGLLALSASLTLTPPSLSASLSAAIDLVASLQAAIALGMPGVDFQVAAVAALIASIQASLGLLLGLQVLFGTAGVFAYAYDGATQQLGPSITSALAPGWPDGTLPASHANAILLGAVSPATWASMKLFFGGV